MTTPTEAAKAAEHQTVLSFDERERILCQFMGEPINHDREMAIAIEAAVLSKLRAPVSDIREGFELTYSADADDPACASDLGHFTNGWRACIMSQVGKPVVMKLKVDATAAVDLIKDEVARLRAPVAIPPATAARTEQATGHDRLLRALASQEARDGIGALDALYDLATKHGASKTAAAGFAHVANGAFAALEGQVHDEIRRHSLVVRASAPVAGEAQDADPTTKDQYRRMFTAACEALGAVNKKLGLDPNDGEPDAMLSAIDELIERAASAAPQGFTLAGEAAGEIVLFGGDLKEVSWRDGKMPPPGTKLYAAPQASAEPARILFPAHLRKMWSGGEVQAWLDQHQGVTTPPATAKGSLARYQQWKAEKDQGAPCTCPSGDGSLRHPCPAHPPGKPPAPSLPTDKEQA